MSTILSSLMPTLRISPRWQQSWLQRDRNQYVNSARIVHILVLIGYLSHLFYVDILYGLEPRINWIWLRSIAIALNVGAFFLTLNSRFMSSSWNRLPMMVMGWGCSLLQGVALSWYPKIPHMFLVAIPAVPAVALKMSPISSVLYLVSAFLFQVPYWIGQPTMVADIVSAAIVGAACVGILRSRMSTDIRIFISEQVNLESQKKLIQLEMEMNEQVKTLLPKEIYRRFEKLVRDKRWTAAQAMVEVLDCREKPVACLYSDIRGFTKFTKTEQGFIVNKALPSIRRHTDTVETFGGIPKIVGDLVFSYFDQESERGIFKAIECAFALDEQDKQNKIQNSVEPGIDRFLILSFGNAYVGNIGGTEGARDINVLGNPANILSRIDPLTKEPGLRPYFSDSHIILTNDAAKNLRKICPTAQMSEVSLSALNLKIRDFEEEEFIWILSTSQFNRELIRQVVLSLDLQSDSVVRRAA